jgi:hypothetical protein
MDVPFLPRQTFVGDVEYFSNAFETGDYNKLIVIFKQYGTIGSSPTVTVTMQTSSDMRNWVDISGDLSADTVESKSNLSKFLRAKVVLAGTDPAATLSVLGKLVQE